MAVSSVAHGSSAIAAPTRFRRAGVPAAVVASTVVVAGVAMGVGGSPLLAFAALAAVPAVVIYALSPTEGWQEACTGLFVFLLYTNLLVVATRFHGVPVAVLSFSYILLAAPLATYAVLRREPIMLPAAFPYLVLYLAALCLSAALADNVAATSSPVWNFVIEGLVLYLLIANTVRTPEALRRMIWILLLGAALMGALSVWQEVTGSYDNVLGGLTQTNQDDLKVAEDLDGNKVLRDRLGGTLGSPNRYAQILAVVVPLAVLRATGERRRSLRVLAALAAILAAAGIMLTFSRGTAVALAAVLLLMLVARAVRARHVLFAAVAVVLVMAVAAPDYLSRLRSLGGVEQIGAEEGAGPDGAVLGRLTSNLASLNVFLDHPIVGVGPLQYFQQYSLDEGNEVGIRYRDSRRRAHNLYLEMAADTGLVGLTSFLLVAGVTMAELWRLARYWRDRRPDLANLAYSLLFALATYLACALFLQLSYQRYLWMLMGLGAAGTLVLRRVEGGYADPGPVAALDGSDREVS